MAKKASEDGKRVRAVLLALRRDHAKARVTRGAAPTAMAASAPMAAPAIGAAGAVVTFICSRPGCVVGITCAGADFSFPGTGAHAFPVGRHELSYRVNGPSNATFRITASGAPMSPINDVTDNKGRAAGASVVTVS